MSRPAPSPTLARRGFLRLASFWTMLIGLVASYGTLFYYALRFLFPARGAALGWQFVAVARELKTGESLAYVAPSGARVVVARQRDGDGAEAFIALSSVCPHLGCQVHWESPNQRFFCPCHNGAFDREGRPTEGPPAAAGQQLTRFPLRVENGLLYVQVPLHSVTAS